MTENDADYIARLEKIVDNQDNLLNHFDSRLEQANHINNLLRAENDNLHNDLKKHKSLLKDMKKALTQHKNVISNLKKELEGQLEVQQKLHEEYNEMIKDLENKNNTLITNNTHPAITGAVNKPTNNVNKNNNSSGDKVTLPPKDFGNDHVENVKEAVSSLANSVNLTEPGKSNEFKCPKCGSTVDDSLNFCIECGYKLK